MGTEYDLEKLMKKEISDLFELAEVDIVPDQKFEVITISIMPAKGIPQNLTEYFEKIHEIAKKYIPVMHPIKIDICEPRRTVWDEFMKKPIQLNG